MKCLTLIVQLAILGVSITACGSSPSADADDPTPTVTITATPTLSDAPSQAPTPAKRREPKKPKWNLPNGYPKVVAVASLPDQVRNWYQMNDATSAVAIAPGVWAEMQPGASLRDVVEAQVYDGFCASLKASERKYLSGQEVAGTCW